MRKVEFNDLKLRNIDSKEDFYDYYLKNFHEPTEKISSLDLPDKQYEIFYLDNFDDKIFLLNKMYIKNTKDDDKELFYDYSIAYKVYNLMLDINDGIKGEQNEFNELYKEERIEKYKQILDLKKQDDILFVKALDEYNILRNSELYKNYTRLLEENDKLRVQVENLTQQLNANNVGFFKRLVNKFTRKRLPM